ncbi:AfsR/SARP family transcriptional regulator [Actinophytocola xanthii]|uniref:AfsR/SARP family transcriptional regulator n=1 Tax=Actinophytocola xanthii TaxID=1912961 RepID=UPI001E419ACA|nr:AfsR/SARP family transcriptional regulator [Actinophytocola xanthii]
MLGPLEVSSEAGRVMLPSPRHQRVLAALLLAPNSVVPTARLVEAMWDREPPATATKQVQNCVSALRERLGRGSAVIVTDGPGYRIVVSDSELDALRFHRELETARRRAAEGSHRAAVLAARAALRLWRGPALAGLDAVALAGPVMRLNEQRLHAIRRCADWQLELGEYDRVVEELTEVVAQHPLDEGAHARLMTALAASGRQGDALAVHQALRTRLVEDLGVDPGAEVQAAHARILAAPPPVPRAPGTSVAPSPQAPPVRRDPAVEDLAVAVTRQWTAEAQRRSLHRPEPVPLRWCSTARPVSARTGVPAGRAVEPDQTDIVATFRQAPHRQLVILGEPGAGKSVMAIQLTLGLLADPEPDEPIPVLLPVASWDPHREHLHQWLTARLLEDYPGLANTAEYGPDAAARLVLDGRIIPILDGLDETPPALHAAAIEAIDHAVTAGRPLVVTCRTTEYERAVTRTGSLLTRATVVEIEPVDLEAAIRFLTARARAGDTRWDPVVDHLHQNPTGPLAQALRTPLMIDLARAAYASPSADPRELCDTARLDDAERIEEHLLDACLPTAYADRPPPPRGRPRLRRSYDSAQARRWLAYLARHLHEQRTYDLAWWRLDRAVPPQLMCLMLSAPAAVVFGLTGWVAAGPREGAVYGLAFLAAGYVAHRTGHRPGPLRAELRLRGTGGRYLRRFVAGVSIGVAFGLPWSLSVPHTMLLAAVFGLAVGTHIWLDTPVDVDRVTSPTTVLRGDRRAAWIVTLSFMASLGLFYGMCFSHPQRVPLAVILDGEFSLVLALSSGLTSGLVGRFLLGRPGALCYGLAGAVVGGLFFPRATSLEHAVAAGVLFAVAVGLSVCLARAWGAFAVARLYLAGRGHLPLRLMRFLEDAHRREILRQVGAVHQFRHGRLQDRLARRAETRSPLGSAAMVEGTSS